MKRRDTFRLIPLSIAGMAGMRSKVISQEMQPKHHMAGFPEPLAIRYTKKVREMLTWIRHTQSENLLEASYAIAGTVKNKRTCWYAWDMGHTTTFDLIPGRNGVPEIFTMGYDPEKSRDGDLFLCDLWGGPYEDLEKKDILVIGSRVPFSLDARGDEIVTRKGAQHRVQSYSDIWIESNLTKLGAIMNVPGMPAPIGPVSGIIGMLTFWMMMADTCRILARNGISVKVRGDEPIQTSDKVPYDPSSYTRYQPVSLVEPLMDDYFNQIMQQIELIGAEFGNIQRIAKMAVDSLLAGGKVYCYSRYSQSLCYEAHERRGGLALTQGIYERDGKLILHGRREFKGTPQDTVIMGIFQPDDEADLRHLDTFRKYGMKVVSMGPMTRDINIPEGRTVPKETDVHVGRMCDTYGMYVIPGFERKVCPTSGALLNQIFWATCMEIVEEMIRRTGNVPAVFYSASIKDGREFFHRMKEIYEERGY